MSKNCKVIATYFGPRRNKPNGVDETILFWEEKILKYEYEIDPGVDMDTIIINHDFKNEKVKDYLNSLDGKQTKRGEVRIYNRDWEEGIGGSFASFNKGFEIFMNEYDYWFFTEDNVIMIHDNYYNMALNQLKNSDDVFICCMRAGAINHKIKHCDGACGLTSKNILLELYTKLGNLPYSKQPIDKKIQDRIKNNDLMAFKSIHNEVKTAPSSWYYKFCYEGEVKFTNEIINLGYSISELECNEKVAMWHEYKY
jgi:hypothetical protein